MKIHNIDFNCHGVKYFVCVYCLIYTLKFFINIFLEGLPDLKTFIDNTINFLSFEPIANVLIALGSLYSINKF